MGWACCGGAGLCGEPWWGGGFWARRDRICGKGVVSGKGIRGRRRAGGGQEEGRDKQAGARGRCEGEQERGT